MAERRIAEKTGQGVVCFISNYSWLDGLSFTGMRERFLEAFDAIRIDNLHGDRIQYRQYRSGRFEPVKRASFRASRPDPPGIKIGTSHRDCLVRKVGNRHRYPAASACSVSVTSIWAQS